MGKCIIPYAFLYNINEFTVQKHQPTCLPMAMKVKDQYFLHDQMLAETIDFPPPAYKAIEPNF